MNAFYPEIDKENGFLRVFDTRYTPALDITSDRFCFGGLSYTLAAEDIHRAPATDGMPYAEYTAGYERVEVDGDRVLLKNEAFGVETEATFFSDHVTLSMTCTSDAVSEWGMALPFNSLNQDKGNWRSQLISATIYHTADERYWFSYLTRADGKPILAVAESPVDGLKMDYYQFRLEGIRFLANFDRAFGYASARRPELTVHIYPVADYAQALERVAQVWKRPVCAYDVSACHIGDSLELRVFGEWNRLRVEEPERESYFIENTNAPVRLSPSVYGLTRVTPFQGETVGADCTVFAYDDWKEFYRRACYAVPQHEDVILGRDAQGNPVWEPTYLCYRGYKDFNACEHAMWCPSALRYMQLFGRDAKLERDVKNFLTILTAEDPTIQIPRCTVIAGSQEGYPDGCTLESDRLQEAFNAAGMLLDAYELFGEERYREHAVKVLQGQIGAMDADGCLRRPSGEDYTTVTCLVLALVDAAVVLEREKDPRGAQMRKAALDMTDFIVRRGLSFPTEGGCPVETKEDGSMSCSALSALYCYAYLEQKPEYLTFAKEILDYHDAWISHVSFPPAFYSTMRWWETKWEGDGTGSAICYGHGWTIWRAEADFYYGILAKDPARLLASYNGYMSNLSKADKEGNLYAIYQNEPIPYQEMIPLENRVFSDGIGFPEKKDVTLSRYVFARARDTWYSCTAVLGETVLNGARSGAELVSYAPRLRQLFISDFVGELTVKATEPVALTALGDWKLLQGTVGEFGTICPQNGKIRLIFE